MLVFSYHMVPLKKSCLWASDEAYEARAVSHHIATELFCSWNWAMMLIPHREFKPLEIEDWLDMPIKQAEVYLAKYAKIWSISYIQLAMIWSGYPTDQQIPRAQYLAWLLGLHGQALAAGRLQQWFLWGAARCFLHVWQSQSPKMDMPLAKAGQCLCGTYLRRVKENIIAQL